MKNSLKSIVTTGISVMFGFAIGVSSAHWQIGPRGHHPPPPPGDRGQFVEHFSEQFDLSAEQKQKVSSIFEKQREQMKELRVETMPKFRAIREATRLEIEKVLDAPQLLKFNEVHQVMENRRKKLFPGWDRGRRHERRGGPRRRGGPKHLGGGEGPEHPRSPHRGMDDHDRPF